MSSTITGTSNSVGYSLDISNDGNFASFTDQLVYEIVRLSDCEYDQETETFYYLCPCGDVFEITLDDLLKGNVVSECPSCSLRIRIDLKPGELEPFVQMRGL